MSSFYSRQYGRNSNSKETSRETNCRAIIPISPVTMKTKSRSSPGTHSYIARHSLDSQINVLDLQTNPVQQRNLQISALDLQTNPAQQKSVQQKNLQINALDLQINAVRQAPVELQMASIINALDDILLTDTANQIRKTL